MNILKIEGLRLNLGKKEIIDGLNIEIWDGQIHAIVGPNGAGKSTLASTIMGLDGYRDYTGNIFFQNMNIDDFSIFERASLGITMGWQEPARYEGLSVKKFIQAAAKDKDSIQKSLEIVGMDPSEYMERSVDKSMSGGERKKIELASIVAMQPKLLILDEPDSGIDVASLQNIFEAIKFLKSNGSTIILITHSLEVLNQAENAFLLCNGQIVDKGSIDKIRKYFEGKCLPCSHKNAPQLNGKEGAIVWK
jgi:Fe-S cluster assembly ATP-binding protein